MNKNILLEISSQTKLISDTHFFHSKIFEFEKIRKEKMIEDGFDDHEEWLINTWNTNVSEDDIVIVLGDFAFKSVSVATRLNGRKILILGNHDKKGPNVYKDFEYVVRGNIKIEDERIYINETVDKLESTLEMIVEHERVLFSHYPATKQEYRFSEDESKFKNNSLINNRIHNIIDLVKYNDYSLNFHGHTHSKCYDSFENGTLFVNCCVEKIWYPQSIEYILESL